ncbi:hypothetical protein G0U57_010375 [Chelydra serpentina]|uniref:Uncharacterized protein n=1 Tax=Chelydra serpentina TaxID=8475 RepID=A0A8T1RWH9_CHESE|nr:hypothetical protein G0U57_010375 [Chelydra serpentina]
MFVFPGDLPAPSLFLDKSLIYVGDTVLYWCLTPSNSPMIFAFLCKDGKEMARKPAVPGKFSFDFPYHVTGQSSGNFSCGYQHKVLHNQVWSSHLSIARYLHVTGEEASISRRITMFPLFGIRNEQIFCLVAYCVNIPETPAPESSPFNGDT